MNKCFSTIVLMFVALLFLIVACSDDDAGEVADVGHGDAESSDSGDDDTAIANADQDSDVEMGDSGGDASEADDDEPVPPMVSPSLWNFVSAEDDPLQAHRPDEVDCPTDAVKTELLDGDLSYAVDMEQCNYLAVSQSSLVGAEAGDILQARIWHFSLTPPPGEESGMAHIAILFDGDIAWQSNVEIPADGQLLTPRWEASEDYPVGTEVIWHLHNHGDNQWNFIDLAVAD